MKKIFSITLISIILISCKSIKVASDYDSQVDFNNYKTYAFYKPGIDELEISDIDKKRILNSIKNSLQSKGLVISNTPDILINISTKSTKNFYIDYSSYNSFYAGWYPFGGLNYSQMATSSVDGILYIDIIDSKAKQLVWQGKGVGALSSTKSNRDELINNFVTKILEVYPPNQLTSEIN
jgi:hypothetical protein